MLVCHCHSVTDRAIREAVRGGAQTADCIRAACGAGDGCGGCSELVECIVLSERLAQGAHHERPHGPSGAELLDADAPCDSAAA